MKGKQRSLNGLFWRYLLSTMALLAGVLLALWFVLLQLIRMGAVLPADTGARNLERTTVLLQAQETFDPGEIPFYYRWALADSSGILESNLSPKEETWAQKVLAGEVSRHGFLYTKYYWSVPLSGGRVCLLQYDYAVCYANPTLQERLPDFQLLFFLVCLGCLVLVALWRTHHYTKGLRRDAQAITLACNGVAQQTLDTPFPAQAQVRELQAALTALDTLRREYPAQAGQSIPAEHPAGADIPAQAPAGDTGNCAGRNNPRTIPARGAWVPSVVSSAHPASNPAEHPAQGDEPAAREEVEQLRDALRSLSDVELAACLFHVDPASSDARPMSAVFLREMSRRDPVRSFATFKAWRAGDIPPDVRALLDSLADGDPDAGGD